MRILLLEDDPGLGRGVAEYLRLSGHQVAWATRIAQAEDELHGFLPELLLLDLSLPDGSGLDFLGALRRHGDQRPAIILTARDQVRDRIAGLNTGADDYLVKPFDLAELGARIASVARRTLGPPRTTCHAGAVSLDLAEGHAVVAGQPVQMTGREMAVLALLARRPGHAVTRASIEEALRDLGGDFESNAVEVYVGRIRRKLGHDAIETLRGIGYRLRP
ncbi:response regulator transcription factor [Sediminicoccus rosea]|jgi:two-component system OmpR family response regulator|uniref:Response regulator transcription factor n=1 Tax=Sediminicoccus rosea TaxID=1225128 RepID=A0ABZ0PJW5_9PROT|nr:response regulator transcription factor [Sediminicoccus rosea]WPB86024.1 response regulator transcription factor [Sediminicoccus rosea]